MSSRFPEIVPGHAPVWAHEVANPREFSIIAGRHPPAVAFTLLNLNAADREYLSGLQVMKETSGSGITRFPDKQGRIHLQRNFVIANFFRQPEESGMAMRSFVKMAEPFFPPSAQRTPLLQKLAFGFAEATSAVDCSRLFFSLRAAEPGFAFHMEFHEDKQSNEKRTDSYSFGVYLLGKTSLHASPGSYSKSDRMEKADGDTKYYSYNHKQTPKLLEQAMHLPGQCMAAWHGEQPHATPPPSQGLRLSIFAFTRGINQTPALRGRLGWWAGWQRGLALNKVLNQ